MTWYAALQLAIQLIQAITPIIGQIGHNGHDLVTVSALPSHVQNGLRQLVAHLDTVALVPPAAPAVEHRPAEHEPF